MGQRLSSARLTDGELLLSGLGDSDTLNLALSYALHDRLNSDFYFDYFEIEDCESRRDRPAASDQDCARAGENHSPDSGRKRPAGRARDTEPRPSPR